jgi:hypothetical protein
MKGDDNFLSRYSSQDMKYVFHISFLRAASFSFTVKPHKVQLEDVSPESYSHNFDCECVLLVKFMAKDQTINTVLYFGSLMRRRCTIQNQCQDQLSTGVVLLYDNVQTGGGFILCRQKDLT